MRPTEAQPAAEGAPYGDDARRESLAIADAELARRVLAGELRAFEQIMRRHNRRLYRIARSILKDAGESEDVVQESYVRAYEKLADFKGPAGFGNWLARIAVNESLMRLRRRKPVDLFSDCLREGGEEDREPLMHSLRSTLPDPEQLASSSEIRRLLETAIDGLPDSFRAVFVLRAIEELSVKDTAAILGLRPETVKTRFHRARAMLRDALSARLLQATGSIFDFAGARCDRIVAHVLRRIAASAAGPPPRR